MYTQDNNDYMAYPNWGTTYEGWLYTGGAIPDPTLPPYNANLTLAYMGGLWFQYVKTASTNSSIYFCPVDKKSPRYATRPNKLSSYIMNGAVCGYGRLPAVNYGNPRSVKINSIWTPVAYLMWEPDENLGATAGAFNDASSFPDRNEGVGRLHVTGAVIMSLDGHVSSIKFDTYNREQNTPPAGVTGKGMLWWYPGSIDGH